MSVNATTAAKRRRAGNIVNTQLFKSNDAPIQNTIQRRTMQQSNSPQIPQTPQTSAPANIQQQPPSQGQAQPIEQSSIGQRPMSLQQVISVFDKRLLTIEGHILNNKPIESVNQVVSQQPSVDFEQLKSEIDNNFQNQFSEFDHRYELLAIEITNLKEIILKLQSYTLEFENICKKRKQIIKCESRHYKIESKYKTNSIWIIWDILLDYATSMNNEFILKTMEALNSLFCIKYTEACAKRRRYLLYYAVGLLTETSYQNKELVINRILLQNVINKIEEIYKQIKKNEVAPKTDYLFKGLDKKKAIEKSLKQLEIVNSIVKNSSNK